MTTIGVIGAGHIGRNFSIAAIERGYDIVITTPPDPRRCRISSANLARKPEPRRPPTPRPPATSRSSRFRCRVRSLAGRAARRQGRAHHLNYFPQRDGHFPESTRGS